MTAHSAAMPVLDALAWLGPRKFFHELSPRARVVLSQLPLSAIMVPVLVIAWTFHPELFANPVFMVGMVLHAVMFVLCCIIAWHRLPGWAVLTVPILDFVPIGLVREPLVEVMPAAGTLAAFPVVWLAGAGIFPRFCMVMTFVGPLLMVWVPLLLTGSASAEKLSAVLLLPLIMVAIGFGIRTLSASMADQRRSLEAVRDQLQHTLDDSARKERLLHTVLETVGVGVTALDQDGNTSLSNRQQQRLNAQSHSPDRTGDGAQGTAMGVFAGGCRQPLSPEEHPVRRAARGESFSEYLICLGEGDRQRVYSTSARVITEAGRFDGSVITFMDVSHLIAAIKAKDAFLSNVSHELRTPLTSILGYVGILQESTALPPGASEALSVIESNAGRLQRLVADLLSAASGSVDVAPEPADFAEIIRQSLRSAAPMAAAAGVDLVDHVRGSLPAVIDPVRTAQVLDNLLSNAVKYSPNGGTITVAAHSTGQDIVCTVTDTGIGMTEAEQAQLFTRFFRAETVRHSAIAGIGLGLAICKTIVENHGGSIRCASAPDHGSTFTLTLPTAARLAEPPGGKTEEPETPREQAQLP